MVWSRPGTIQEQVTTGRVVTFHPTRIAQQQDFLPRIVPINTPSTSNRRTGRWMRCEQGGLFRPSLPPVHGIANDDRRF